MSDTENQDSQNAAFGKQTDAVASSSAERVEGKRLHSSLNIARLNTMLGQMTDGSCRIASYSGTALQELDVSWFTAIAECYVQLAYEKWHEKWSVETACNELRKKLQDTVHQENFLTLLYHEDNVVGICWAKTFTAQGRDDEDNPFSSPRLQNSASLDRAWAWLDELAPTEKLVSIRELGLLKRFSHIRAPVMCIPAFNQAQASGCKYIFVHTPKSDEDKAWCRNMGFEPLYHINVNQVLLVLADLESTIKEYEFRVLEYFASRLSDIIERDQNVDELLHRAELNNNERLHVMQRLSANIAHEMRTPLSGVRATMAGVEDFLPVLVETYRKAKEAFPESTPSIREEHLAILASTPQRISLMVDQANSVIDMLLMNLRDNAVDRSNFGIFSARACVKQAVDRYTFKRGEREKVILNLDHDFYFRGLDTLFIYVIFNLLKNALYSISSALEGGIVITLTPGKGGNVLTFHDTGEGIPTDIIERVFEGFFSTREEGTGVGLAFCRQTIQSFDGDITCKSEPGAFAEFTITLPPV
jgi:signal transduction histidine kinase